MKVRRISKRIEVFRPGQTVPVDFRLSGEENLCTAVQVLIVGQTLRDRSVIPNFGEYSLEFEGKKVHPINFIVPLENRVSLDENSRNRPDLLPLHVELDNKIVSGYYRDLAAQKEGFKPYSVRFTFHLAKR